MAIDINCIVNCLNALPPYSEAAQADEIETYLRVNGFPGMLVYAQGGQNFLFAWNGIPATLQLHPTATGVQIISQVASMFNAILPDAFYNAQFWISSGAEFAVIAYIINLNRVVFSRAEVCQVTVTYDQYLELWRQYGIMHLRYVSP